MLPDIFVASPALALWYGRSNTDIIFDLRKQSASDKLFGKEKIQQQKQRTQSRHENFSKEGDKGQTEQKPAIPQLTTIVIRSKRLSWFTKHSMSAYSANVQTLYHPIYF